MRLLLVLLIISSVSLAQNIDYSQFEGQPVSTSLTVSIPGVSFLNYKPPEEIVPLFASEDSVSIQKVEDILIAIISANNEGWIKGYLGEAVKDSLFDRLMNERIQSAKLLAKMTIKDIKQEKTILKFVARHEGSAATIETWVLEKNTDSWVITNNTKDVEDLFYIVSKVKPDVLRKLLVNVSFSDKQLDELREKTRVHSEKTKEYLDVAKLKDVLLDWRTDNSTLWRKASDNRPQP